MFFSLASYNWFLGAGLLATPWPGLGTGAFSLAPLSGGSLFILLAASISQDYNWKDKVVFLVIGWPVSSGPFVFPLASYSWFLGGARTATQQSNPRALTDGNPRFPQGGPLETQRFPCSVFGPVFDTEKDRYGT